MKKAVALIIVWGITIVIALLAIGAIYLMGNQAFLAEHKIRRIQAYYTAKAAIIHALEELRQGVDPDGTSINLNGMQADISVGTTISASPIYGGIHGCRPVSATVDYSR